MRFSSWYFAPVLLCGCAAQTPPQASGPVTAPALPASMPASNAAPTHPAHNLLESLVRQAHAKRDLKMMKSLVHQVGVDAQTLAVFEASARADFQRPIQNISFEKLDPQSPLQYMMRGVTYRPTLPPTARLRIEFKPPPGEDAGKTFVTSTSYLIGHQNEIYYLVLAGPVKPKAPKG